MKAIRLGNKLLRTLVRDRMFYPGRLFMDTVAITVRCGVLLTLYSYVFRLNGGTINNTAFIVAAWSMFLYFSFSVFRLRDISRAIMQDVQTGNVEMLFSKPVSYLSYRMWWQVGTGLYQFLVISIIGTLVLALVIGLPPLISLPILIPTLGLTLFLGIILSLFLYAIVGLFSFWIEDINPVYWIVDKTTMILGGSYLPVALFPGFMYKMAVWSPFGASQFVTHTVYGAWETEWPMKIGIQIAWVIVTALVAILLFHKAKQEVSVNGG